MGSLKGLFFVWNKQEGVKGTEGKVKEEIW
jgi:hypothetical protein